MTQTAHNNDKPQDDPSATADTGIPAGIAFAIYVIAIALVALALIALIAETTAHDAPGQRPAETAPEDSRPPSRERRPSDAPALTPQHDGDASPDFPRLPEWQTAKMAATR